jgi:hypothetical protein
MFALLAARRLARRAIAMCLFPSDSLLNLGSVDEQIAETRRTTPLCRLRHREEKICRSLLAENHAMVIAYTYRLVLRNRVPVSTYRTKKERESMTALR